MLLFLAEDSEDELQSSDCFLLREIRNLSDSLVQSFRVCLSLYHKFTMAWMYLTHFHQKKMWEANCAFQQLQTLCLWRPGQLTQDCRFWVGVEDWLARRSRSYSERRLRTATSEWFLLSLEISQCLNQIEQCPKLFKIWYIMECIGIFIDVGK